MQFNEDAGTEASLNSFVQGLLKLALRHFAPEGVSDEALTIRVVEIIRDTGRMPVEGQGDD